MTQKRRQLSRERRRRQLRIRRAVVLLLLAAVLLLVAMAVVKCTSKFAHKDKEKQADKGPQAFTVALRFAGDMNFDDDYDPMQHFKQSGESIENVIDPEYISLMKDADLMWINNEFCYSDRGERYPGKAYTFRSDPANVSILKDLGVDVAGLANNHVFDYQEEALLDTFDTLKDAGIPYVGAGHDIKEASAPVYAKAGPLKVAFVAAERAEKYQIVTREATEDQAGVLRCYDNARFVASIKEAAEHADYVIALPHWGTENETTLEEAQTDGAREYLDAGADAVVGAHPHVLQGIDFYEDQPIVYSLGNFWFDGYDRMTMIAEIRISGKYEKAGESVKLSDLKTELVLYPGMQSGMETRPAKDAAERDKIFRHLESISDGITINDQGIVTK